MTQQTGLVTDEHLHQFHTNGYFVLESVLSDEDLEGLRNECTRFITDINAEMDARGVTTWGISHRDKRYFIGNRHHESTILTNFLFGDLMAEVSRAVLGDYVYLFNEQYVVKMAEVGMKFAWHQDSGYIGYDHKPYLSCWCALDDMSEENGTVHLLPFDRAGGKHRRDHVQEEGTNDMVGYHGDDPGEPAVIPAGSVAVFSSTTFHRSGANTTNDPRRVFLAQYSGYPILTQDGSQLWGHAEHFWYNGERRRYPNS
jgi:ectoine hydroxylase-related dioxygenase (phytanoyl-CoA dioxygenase family)